MLAEAASDAWVAGGTKDKIDQGIKDVWNATTRGVGDVWEAIF